MQRWKFLKWATIYIHRPRPQTSKPRISVVTKVKVSNLSHYPHPWPRTSTASRPTWLLRRHCQNPLGCRSAQNNCSASNFCWIGSQKGGFSYPIESVPPLHVMAKVQSSLLRQARLSKPGFHLNMLISKGKTCLKQDFVACLIVTFTISKKQNNTILVKSFFCK